MCGDPAHGPRKIGVQPKKEHARAKAKNTQSSMAVHVDGEEKTRVLTHGFQNRGPSKPHPQNQGLKGSLELLRAIGGHE